MSFLSLTDAVFLYIKPEYHQEGTSQGTRHHQLHPRAVGMEVAQGPRRQFREHGRAGAKPPGHTRVQSPRWSRQWCPCHPSGTPTGTHLSGWRFRTWRTRYSCWAPVCCEKQAEMGLRALWRLSSGGQVGDACQQLLPITATTKAKRCT